MCSDQGEKAQFPVLGGKGHFAITLAKGAEHRSDKEDQQDPA